MNNLDKDFTDLVTEAVDDILKTDEMQSVGKDNGPEISGEDVEDTRQHAEQDIKNLENRDQKKQRMSNVLGSDNDGDGEADGIGNISDRPTHFTGIYGESFSADKGPDTLNPDQFVPELGGNGQPLNHTEVRCGYCDGTGIRGGESCNHCGGTGKVKARETQPGQAKDQPTIGKVGIDSDV